jgi:hypothetical protein
MKVLILVRILCFSGAGADPGRFQSPPRSHATGLVTPWPVSGLSLGCLRHWPLNAMSHKFNAFFLCTILSLGQAGRKKQCC